jgi:putative transposase
VLTDESYAGKCSFLDEEPLAHQTRYVGRRTKRGLFISATGRRLSADGYGAYNIVRKVVPNAFGNGIGGVVVHPVRLDLANWRLAS